MVTTAASNASGLCCSLCCLPRPPSLVACSSAPPSLSFSRVGLGEMGLSPPSLPLSLGKWWPVGKGHGNPIEFLSPALPCPSLSSLSLLCASVCFGSSELETAQTSEIEKGGSGHRPAHLKLRWIITALRILRSAPALYTRRRTSFAYPFNFLSSDVDWLGGSRILFLI